jgi:hypothetical protein
MYAVASSSMLIETFDFDLFNTITLFDDVDQGGPKRRALPRCLPGRFRRIAVTAPSKIKVPETTVASPAGLEPATP